MSKNGDILAVSVVLKRCTHVFRLCDCVVLIEETSLYIGEVRLNSLTVTVARDVSVDCREL